MLYVLTMCSLAILLPCIATASWKQLAALPIRLHSYFASIIAITLLWSTLTADVNKVFLIHLSLMVSICLIFGFRLTQLSGFAALVVIHLNQSLAWHNLPFHYLVNVVVPCACANLLLWFLRKFTAQNKANNPLFFTLGAGFGAGIVSSICIGLTAWLILSAFNSTLRWPTQDHLYLYVLLAFPEGFCNGVIISSLAIFKPDMLKNYDEQRFTRN